MTLASAFKKITHQLFVDEEFLDFMKRTQGKNSKHERFSVSFHEKGDASYLMFFDLEHVHEREKWYVPVVPDIYNIVTTKESVSSIKVIRLSGRKIEYAEGIGPNNSDAFEGLKYERIDRGSARIQVGVLESYYPSGIVAYTV